MNEPPSRPDLSWRRFPGAGIPSRWARRRRAGTLDAIPGLLDDLGSRGLPPATASRLFA